MRQLDADYKLGKNVKISMLYLEDDDAVAAEQYIKKASSLIAGCKQPALELQYRSCYVRILDAKRRFVEAAQRYYEISQMQTDQVLICLSAQLQRLNPLLVSALDSSLLNEVLSGLRRFHRDCQCGVLLF